MKKAVMTIVFLAASFASVTAQKNEAAGDREVKFESHAKARYFEKNNSGLKGNSSYLAFTSFKKFEQ